MEQQLTGYDLFVIAIIFALIGGVVWVWVTDPKPPHGINLPRRLVINTNAWLVRSGEDWAEFSVSSFEVNFSAGDEVRVMTPLEGLFMIGRVSDVKASEEPGMSLVMLIVDDRG
jgi:hypothetical protein